MSKREFIVSSNKIFTALADRPWVEAVGVKDGKIAAIGNEKEVRTVLPRAEMIEARGSLVAPGLVDAHCHFVSFGRFLSMVNLKNLPNLEAFRQKTREGAARLAPGEWLLGRGWDHHQWPEGREPNKNDLDDIVPDNPVMLIRSCGHSICVNSRALEIAGITAATPDPPGGKIERDESGRPNGVIKEARELVADHIPPPDLEQLKKYALDAQEQALKSGLTGVHTCESLLEWRVLSALDREGLLKLRVHHLIQPHDLETAIEMGLGPGYGSDRLWIGHLKLFADGSLGSGTALLFEPYSDEPGNCGLATLEENELLEKIQAAYAGGYSVAIHAIGDKAGSNALRALAAARKNKAVSFRDRIEHIQLFRPADLALYREMDVTASVQPVFTSTDWSIARKRWADRVENAYAWKTIMNNGIRMQFGSDAPVEPINPIFGLQAAVLRQTTDLQPENGWRPEQRLGLEESLSGFVKTAAWTSFKEDRLGSLEPGKMADLTIFEQDLSEVPAEEWSKMEIETTIIDGEVVFRK